MKPTTTQRGNTLIVALIMLLVMTLAAVTALNMSTTNIQVVGNMQFQEEAVAAAQQAVENVITKEAFNAEKFTEATPVNQTVNVDGADYQVTFANPSCVSIVPADTTVEELPKECYSGPDVDVTACYWGIWDIEATATNQDTGASATVHQGVKVLTGEDAALASCGV